MAADGWRTVRFQDLIDGKLLEIGDGYRAKNSELGGEGPIFLRAGQVSDSHVSFDGAERFHARLANSLRSKMSKAGDTMVTTKGNSTGRTSFVASWMPSFVYSPHLSYWRSLEENDLAPGFLRYWSKGPEFAAQLHGMMESTDMAPYLSLTDQRRLRVTLPPPTVQHAIARILGTLDDKIDLNRRMNHTLEALAWGVFRSWFMDFDPVVAKATGRKPMGMNEETARLFPESFEDSALGPIPKGWRVGKFGDIAGNPRRSVDPAEVVSGTPYIALEHMPRRQIALDNWGFSDGVVSDKFRFQQGEILFGKLRPYFHKVGVAPTRGVCSTDILVITPKHDDWFGIILGHASSDELIQYADASSTGTKMPRTSWHDLAQYGIVLPSGAVVKTFNLIAKAIADRIAANIHHSHTLAAFRDTLLPKLISGELRIKPAQRVLETA